MTSLISGAERRPSGFSLQQKAWMVTAAILLTLAGLLGVGVNTIFRRGSAELEHAWVADCVHRTQAAQQAEIDALERSARDYSMWSETYEFVVNGDPAYIANNLLPSMFANLQLDAFFVFDLSGGVRLGRVCVEGVVAEEGSESLAAALAPFARRVVAHVSDAPPKGVLRVGDQLALFAVLPVLRDDGSGPTRGALAHLRFLGAPRVGHLREATGLDLSLHLELPRPSGETGVDSFTIDFVDEARLVAHVPLLDVRSNPVGHWELAMARDIHLHGVRTRLVFYVVLTVLIGAAAIVIGWLLRSMVIARLEMLHAAVQRVGATGDLSVRVPVRGADELASLTEGVNRMFVALEQAEIQRVDAEKERERLSSQVQEAQKLEALGTLAGGLAHDFNNLLTSMLGSIALLQLERNRSAETDQHLKRLERAARHAAQLVRQMMAFGRRGKTVLREVRLGEVVRDAMSLVSPSLPRGIEIKVRSETSEDAVRGDAGQLQQVLINLVTNSGHAMAGGRGTLEVVIAACVLPDVARPETASLAAGDYLRISVHDTGCGIPPEHLSRVFEPFYTTKPVGSGTGLGLSVAHGVVTGHRGAIGIHSEVGRGTTVFIHLPKIAGAAPQAPAPAPTNAGERKVRLLLVDDDTLVRETLEAGLRQLGYAVTCASGATDALRAVEAAPGGFDVLVTDQMMPGLSGSEVGDRLRKFCPSLPMILITGYPDGVDQESLKRHGFRAMLQKPVSATELDQAIQVAIAGAKTPGVA